MQNFQELKLNHNLNASLIKMKFDTPTPVQTKTIPLVLEKKDILASAQTGTGKTAAFCIPMIELIALKKTKKAIILVPTRELAKQVNDVIGKLLFQQSAIKSVCLVGGEPMKRQLKYLKTHPQIIVGTPGRVNDHVQRKSLVLNSIDLLILDEMDRMLDMGFSIQIDEIIKFLPKDKQTLMFSATIPSSIERLAAKYLNNPERVSVAPPNATVVTIKQEVVQVRQEDKYNTLVEHVKRNTGSTLVFMKTKHNAKKLAKNLLKEGFEADSLHGNLRQNKRNQVIAKFRANKIHVLVATDIAARGLDIPHIEHVINYDLPQQAEDFIHRMGRTGRAGASGTAWSYVTPSDKRKWNEIEKILHPGLTSITEQKNNQRRDEFKKKSFQRKSSRRDKFRFRDKPRNNEFKRDNQSTSQHQNNVPSKNDGYRRKNKSSFRDKKAKHFRKENANEFRSSNNKDFRSKPKSSNYGKNSASYLGNSSNEFRQHPKSSKKFGFKKRFNTNSGKSFRSRNKNRGKKNFSPTLN
jgi:ATP-dependent RNA helicase DeaD